jgi:hypothetical protein
LPVNTKPFGSGATQTPRDLLLMHDCKQLRPWRSPFILELPLPTSPADERACAIMLDAAPNIANAVLGEGLRRVPERKAATGGELIEFANAQHVPVPVLPR